MPALGAGGGQGGIGGDPGAIEAAADQVRGGATAIGEAGTSVSGRGDAVVARWEGSASDAAHERIRFLGARTDVGADALSGLPKVLSAYAQALRDAQARYAAAQVAAGVAAMDAASATTAIAAVEAETTVGPVPGNDPGHVGRQRQAAASLDAAVEAGQVAAGQMAGAITAEKVANDVAAAQVNAITTLMAGMSATVSTGPSPAAADWADGALGRRQAAAAKAAAAAQVMHISPTTADWLAYRDHGGAGGDVAGGGGPGRGYGLSPMTEAERLAAVQEMKDGAAGVGGAVITDVGFVWAAIDSLPSIGPEGVRWNYLENFREDMARVEGVKDSAAQLMGADTSSEAYHHGEMAYTVVSTATGVGGLVKGAVHIGEVVLTKVAAKSAAKAAAKDAAEEAGKQAARDAGPPVDLRKAAPPPVPAKAPIAVPAQYAKMKFVEAASGVKGSRPPDGPAVAPTWNPDLRTLNANTVYRIDGRHIYVTDEHARVVHIQGDLQLREGADKAAHNFTHASDPVTKNPHKVQGDESGHGLANSLGGAGEEFNRFPMADWQNRVVTDGPPLTSPNWWQSEEELRQILKSDQGAGQVSDLNVNITIKYPDEASLDIANDPVAPSAFNRPTEFRMIATDRGTELWSRRFSNQSRFPVPQLTAG